MKRTIFVLVGILIAASMLLTACGPTATEPVATEPPVVTEPPVATEPPVVAPEPVTISIWHQWSGDYLVAITDVFTEYMMAHPEVTIDLSKPDDVSAALQVAVPAGEGPDIIAWANDQIGTNALNGNIVALDEFGVDMAFLESTYEPAAVNGVVLDDTIYALPETQEGIALVYNKAVATEEFLPTDPTNFQDLYDKAAAFQTATGNTLCATRASVVQMLTTQPRFTLETVSQVLSIIPAWPI